MAKFLCTIQNTFQLEVFGLTVVADIKVKVAKLKIGDEVELHLSDGSQLITKVAGISMLSPYDPERLFSFSLPKNITQEDVPIGKEVWSHP